MTTITAADEAAALAIITIIITIIVMIVVAGPCIFFFFLSFPPRLGDSTAGGGLALFIPPAHSLFSCLRFSPSITTTRL